MNHIKYQRMIPIARINIATKYVKYDRRSIRIFIIFLFRTFLYLTECQYSH